MKRTFRVSCCARTRCFILIWVLEWTLQAGTRLNIVFKWEKRAISKSSKQSWASSWASDKVLMRSLAGFSLDGFGRFVHIGVYSTFSRPFGATVWISLLAWNANVKMYLLPTDRKEEKLFYEKEIKQASVAIHYLNGGVSWQFCLEITFWFCKMCSTVFQ